jgi:hypothetical protein
LLHGGLPDTIVVAVVAKEAWKKNLAYTLPIASWEVKARKLPQPVKKFEKGSALPKLNE